MTKFISHAFFYGFIWSGWRRWAIWAICIGVVLPLGVFRAATDTEFTLASLALLPVLVIAWLGGKWNGLFMAFFAATLWGVGDVASDRQFSASWIPWVNAAVHWMTYSLVAILASLARLQLNVAQETATTDALTGLQNRLAFLDKGDIEVERAKRYAHPLSVVFLDLDDFKQLNDTKGHDAGDAALRATARALLGTLRSNDQVARLGGDEFAVLLPEIGYDEAAETGRKILIAVNSALRDFPPTGGSVGVAWLGRVDRPLSEILKAADEMMYEVKASGKNNLRCRCLPSISKK